MTKIKKMKIKKIEKQYTRVHTVSFEGFSRLCNIYKEKTKSMFLAYVAFLHYHTIFSSNDENYKEDFFITHEQISDISLCSKATIGRTVPLLIKLGLIKKTREEKYSKSNKRKIYYKVSKPTGNLFDDSYRKAIILINKPIITEEKGIKKPDIKNIREFKKENPEDIAYKKDKALKEFEEYMEKDVEKDVNN